MRVYFIEAGSNLRGCGMVRCVLPLQANGWDGDETGLRPVNKSNEARVLGAKNADIVVFHRPDNPKKLEAARIFKAMGKKIVFDNDDTAKNITGIKFNEFMDEERFKRGLKGINEVLDAFIKEADLVTCSTEFLKKEYLELNPNVVVLPNLIDPFYFDEPLRNENRKVRIGIVGSIAITSDMEVLKPIIEHYKDDERVELVLFSLPPNKQDETMRKLYADEYKFWDKWKLEWQPFVPMEEYYETLNNLKLDMLIIPREENYFNKCKSNIKFLEASMFEIPVIAQSFSTKDSPYEQNPEDTKHLFLATDLNSWIENIEKLINNKEMRRNVGKVAKEYVLENYNIETKGHLWKEAYKKLYDSNK